MDGKLILVEGLPGSGKSSTAQFICDQLQRNGHRARWYYEDETPHPVAAPRGLRERMVELIRREAARCGVAIAHSEVVGLIPQAALVESARWYLQLDGFYPEQVLENKIATLSDDTAPFDEACPERSRRAHGGPTEFVDAVAANTATPGGGSAAALAGALAAALTVMVGGEQEAYDRAARVIACFARAVTLLGPAGSGQLTKMVNQICVAGLVEALSEGIHFAKRAGLDIKAVEFHYPFTEIEELACLADETVFVPYIMLEQQSEFQSVVEYYRYLVEETDPSFRFWFACRDDSPDMVAFAREVNGR